MWSCALIPFRTPATQAMQAKEFLSYARQPEVRPFPLVRPDARAFHKLLGPGRGGGGGGGVLPYKRLMALIFPYIFCNSTISKLQKMYGKIEVF